MSDNEVVKLIVRQKNLLIFATVALMITNLIFIVAGFFILTIGSVLLFDVGGKILIIQMGDRYSVGAALMFFGYYLFLVSLFGCYSALTKNRQCLLWYGFGMCFLCIVDFIIGIWALVKSNHEIAKEKSTSKSQPVFRLDLRDSKNNNIVADIINEVFKSDHFKANYYNLYNVGCVCMGFWAVRVLAIFSMFLLLKVDNRHFDDMESEGSYVESCP